MNYLLLVGIDKYSDQNIENLDACVKDVQQFRDILLEKYDFDTSRMVELYNEQATNRNIQDALTKYVTDLDKNSNLIIYYSGHGAYDEVTDRGFWITHDSKEEYSTFLANEVFVGLIRKIQAKHIFIIADCCFSWSIFVNDKPKSIKEFIDNPSRIVLASGRGQTYEKTVENNVINIFSTAIIDYYASAQNDFRVGTLIESVKQSIGSDPNQTAQGGRLSDPNDKGGEFFFKLTNNEPIINKTIKGNKDIYTILKIFTKGGTLVEYPAHEDKLNNVGFKIFEESSSGVYKRKHYFLYLYSGTNLTRTYDAFKKLKLEFKYNQEKQVQNLTILLPKEHGQTTDRRRDHFEARFKPISIFFIDEFIRKECTPRKEFRISDDDEKYLIPNFILPRYEVNSVKHESIDTLSSWLSSEYQPILIVKGAGGIGKTTFSQYLANLFIEENKESYIIFIDSIEIKNELLKKGNNEMISLYNFYTASQESNRDGNEILSEELFRLNLDAGNILIIIDGLDEVISKVKNFDSERFIQSIADYSTEMGSTKVIITCRSYFWESTKYNSPVITTVDLLPFSRTQTNDFFEKAFDKDKRKIEKAIALAKEFQFPDDLGNLYFHPYVLDVIRTIIESDNEVLEHSTELQSNILNLNVKSDYIIFRICYRERFYITKVRILDLTVDEQVKFFSYWAIKRRGQISLENFGTELKTALELPNLDTTIIEAFKSHPLVYINKNSVTFKFDFFADYFKCIYISEFIKLDSDNNSINTDFINILVENCWSGSGMIKDIANRLKVWGDDEILKCSDLISQLTIVDGIESSIKRKAISGLFNICLAANIKFKSNNIDANTSLLVALFGNNNVITDLHIQNLHDSEERVRFNFSDLTFKNCYIENYSSFWDCSFNENTYFINCYLLGLPLNSKTSLPLPKKHFQDCEKDETFDDAFQKESINIANIDELIKQNLASFLNIFYRRGKLEAHNYDKNFNNNETIKQKYARIQQKVFSLKEIVSFLEERKVIQWDIIKENDVLKITDEYKAAVLNVLINGTLSKKINDLIIGLRALSLEK